MTPAPGSAWKVPLFSDPRVVTSVCLVLCYCCAISTGFGQYHFDSWTADNGLPQNSVQAMVQGHDGYLWLATFDGLARFDGLDFTIFNRSNSPGLDSNRLVALYETPGHDLWIGSETGGVTRYHNGEFTGFSTQQGLRHGQVTGISGDERGNVWVLSDNKIVRWAGGRFEDASNNFPADLPFASYVIGRHGRSGFWGVNYHALVHFKDGQLNYWTRGDGLPSLNIQSVAEDQHGALWIVTRDAGLVRIENGKIVKLYPYGGGLLTPWSSFISGLKLQLLTKGPNGELWVIDLESWSRHRLTPHAPQGLVDADRRILVEGVEGGLWIGTNGAGLFRAREQAITVYSQKQGLAGHNIYPICQDPTGAIWIGAWPGSLTRFVNGEFTNYTKQQGLYSEITALYADRTGRVWVATSGGLQILQGGRFTTPPAAKAVFNSLQTVSAIFEDHKGALWFGGGLGLARYRNGAITFYSRKDGLGADQIKVIVADNAGNLWIGGYGGLTRLKDGKFTNYTQGDGLPSNTVRALYVDDEGVLWVGTYDGGLGRLKDRKFTRLTTGEGLFSNGVFQILEDSQGYFWMSCNHGIYRVRKQELNEFAAGKRTAVASVVYGKSDGMLSVECNGGYWPAGIKARDGKLWFPTQDGVAVVDPAAVSINLRPPPVAIESCHVDRAPRPVDRPVRIEPGHDNFEIRYTALSFVNSAQIRFKYELEGLDRSWVDAGVRRTAYYSHVPPGRYTFKVIAANSDGVWNTQEKTLAIVVLPPFYRTWWFLTLASLMAAGTLALAWRYRVAQLKRANSAQENFSRQLIESQERERQRIAAELHDSLGQTMLIIKNRASLALKALADRASAEEQLDEISASASDALEEVRTIAYNLRPYQLDRFGLTKTLQAMCAQASRTSGIHFSTQVEPIDSLFTKQAEINVYRVIQEAINNIIKHSEAAEARCAIRRRAECVELLVEDNGKGFAPVEGDGVPARSGFGLVGMAERVRLMGGTCVVDSSPGHGTRVTIKLLLAGNEHEG